MTMNKIKCTFPKHGTLEKENFNPLAPKCDSERFVVYFEQETGWVFIRCAKNIKHLLTSYQLQMAEVKEDGRLEPISDSNTNNNNGNTNNGGTNVANSGEKINEGTGTNQPVDKPERKGSDDETKPSV